MPILTGDRINVYRMCALKAALKLECLGMTRHGRSVYAIIKEEFQLSGSKQRVLEQFTAVVEAAKGGQR